MGSTINIPQRNSRRGIPYIRDQKTMSQDKQLWTSDREPKRATEAGKALLTISHDLKMRCTMNTVTVKLFLKCH